MSADTYRERVEARVESQESERALELEERRLRIRLLKLQIAEHENRAAGEAALLRSRPR